MGKGPDAAKGGGVVAIEDLKVTKVPRSRCRAPRSARDLRQVRNSHKSVLAGECQRSISALGLRDAENPMRSGAYTETVPRSSITSRRVSGKTAYRRSFCAPTVAGLPNPAGHQSSDRVGER